MRRHLVLSAAAAMAMGTTAFAEGISYDFAQGGVAASSSKFVGDSETGVGIGLAGEAGIWEFLYGFASISSVEYSISDGDVTFTPTSFGVGGHLPLGDVEIFGGLSLERVKLKFNPDGFGSSATSNFSGTGLTAGMRGLLGDDFQWSGNVKYSDLDELDGVVSFTVSGHYYFRSNMAVGLNLTRNQFDSDGVDPETSVLLNFRYDFSGVR